jgi:hypothetical protein
VVWVSVDKAADLAPARACVVLARGLDLAQVSALCCAAAGRLMRYAR